MFRAEIIFLVQNIHFASSWFLPPTQLWCYDRRRVFQHPCTPRSSSSSSGKGKGNIHPRTGHEGPEKEQMYSSTLPSTSALDGGGWSTPLPGRFTPGKDPVPIV